MQSLFSFFYHIDPTLGIVISYLFMVPVIYVIWRTIYLLGKKFTPNKDWVYTATIATFTIVIIESFTVRLLLQLNIPHLSNLLITYSNISTNIFAGLCVWHLIYQVGTYFKPNWYWFWISTVLILVVTTTTFIVSFLYVLSQTNFSL